MLVSVFEK